MPGLTRLQKNQQLMSAGVYTFVFKKTLNAVVKCMHYSFLFTLFIFFLFRLLVDIFVI